ncbi:hypothetical protein IJF89_00355 [Candidatus Saccharibacteria bacterium]|nr:hypothetical protein [Candidatus Saccharibacteria bacterium]
MITPVARVEHPGTEKINIAKTFGTLLKDQFAKDPHFYLFSPDETTSNRLATVYDTQSRAWSLPVKDFDLPSAPDGHIVELLSENTLFATLLGHLSNGEQAMMTSYEAFFSIILSQIFQQIKFYKQMDAVAWRKPWPAVNLLSTSMCWRQDHNGFSHQSPAIISALLDLPGRKVNCLFPVDDSAAVAAFNFMLTSENVVNLTTFDKNDNPRWIDSYHAQFLFDNGGASIYRFASDDDPELILTAAGDLATREMLRAREIIKHDRPETRLRFVGLNSLAYGAIGTTTHPLSQATFDDYFTTHLSILASFHGYPNTLRTILTSYTNQDRLEVHGFEEIGSTTTPMEMLALNHNSRFDLAAAIANRLGRPDLAKKYLQALDQNRAFARANGLDQLPLD